MTSRYLLSKVEAVPGKDVLNPRDYSFGEGSLDGAFVIYRLRKAYPSMSYKRLFNLSDHEVQQWKPFQHVNAEYPLDHLDACKLVFQHPKRNERYTLFFTFSHFRITYLRVVLKVMNLLMLSTYILFRQIKDFLIKLVTSYQNIYPKS